MNLENPLEPGENAPFEAAPAGAMVKPEVAGAIDARPVDWWKHWLGALLAALFSAVSAWLLAESGVIRALPANMAVPTSGTVVMAPTAATTQAADVKNAARVLGVFGALLGMSLPLFAGWSSSSLRAAGAGALGLGLGAASGVVGPLVVIPAYHRWLVGCSEELIYSMLMHTGLWIAPAAVAGVALAMSLGHRKRVIQAALGGAIGAVIGAVIYDVLGAIVFPMAQTCDPIPSVAAARLAEFIVPALAIAAGASRGARP